MMDVFKFLLVISFIVYSVLAENEDKNMEVEQAFMGKELDKDVIKPAPQKKLGVYFEKTKKTVDLGNELTPAEVQEAPKITYEADQKAYYSVLFTDPDAPSRKEPTMREFLHWLVVNIPGSDLSKGEVLTEFIGSAPPKDTDIHRYTFLLFKQPGKVDFKEPKHTKTDMNRIHFSSQKFAQRYNLGNAVAGNFYLAQPEKSTGNQAKKN